MTYAGPSRPPERVTVSLTEPILTMKENIDSARLRVRSIVRAEPLKQPDGHQCGRQWHHYRKETERHGHAE
jgi:hypothetical protein